MLAWFCWKFANHSEWSLRSCNGGKRLQGGLRLCNFSTSSASIPRSCASSWPNSEEFFRPNFCWDRSMRQQFCVCTQWHHRYCHSRQTMAQDKRRRFQDGTANFQSSKTRRSTKLKTVLKVSFFELSSNAGFLKYSNRFFKHYNWKPIKNCFWLFIKKEIGDYLLKSGSFAMFDVSTI